MSGRGDGVPAGRNALSRRRRADAVTGTPSASIARLGESKAAKDTEAHIAQSRQSSPVPTTTCSPDSSTFVRAKG